MNKKILATITVFVLVGTVVLASIADAQDRQRGRQRGGPGGRGGFGQGGRGGPGGGFFGGGFGGGDLMFTLLRNDKVKKELEVIEEQEADVAKIQEKYRAQRRRPDVNFRELSEEEREKLFADMRAEREKQNKQMREELTQVLLPNQYDRLKEISIQIQGTGALNDSEVVAALEITKAQQDKMADVRQEVGEEMRSKMRELFQAGDREAIREAVTKMRSESDKKILAVLTADQRKKFDEMKGDPFDLSMQDLFQFGRGGRGGPGFGGRGGRGGQGGRPQRPQRPGRPGADDN